MTLYETNWFRFSSPSPLLNVISPNIYRRQIIIRSYSDTKIGKKQGSHLSFIRNIRPSLDTYLSFIRCISSFIHQKTVLYLSDNRPLSIRQPFFIHQTTILYPSDNHPLSIRQPSFIYQTTVLYPSDNHTLSIRKPSFIYQTTVHYPSDNRPLSIRQPSFIHQKTVHYPSDNHPLSIR